MKKILAFLALTTASISATASTDYQACAPRYQSCQQPKSCAAFYECQNTEQRKLSELVLTAINEVEVDQMEACKQKRDDVELSIFAHATTIECMDTPQGPQFGG